MVGDIFMYFYDFVIQIFNLNHLINNIFIVEFFKVVFGIIYLSIQWRGISTKELVIDPDITLSSERQ